MACRVLHQPLCFPAFDLLLVGSLSGYRLSFTIDSLRCNESIYYVSLFMHQPLELCLHSAAPFGTVRVVEKVEEHKPTLAFRSPLGTQLFAIQKKELIRSTPYSIPLYSTI